MKLQFIQRYYMPVDPLSASIAAVQTGAGLLQSLVGDAKTKKLMAQRTAYKTPDEIFKILNLSLSGAGGDTITRDFQTNQLDKSFSQMLGGATRLGADANDLSALFNQKINGMLQIGQQFHASNMEALGKVFSAYDLVSQNKAAEWSSQQDIIKDQLQAASAEKAAGIQNLGSGANAFIGLSAASQTEDLYKKIAEALAAAKKKPASGSTAADTSSYTRGYMV